MKTYFTAISLFFYVCIFLPGSLMAQNAVMDHQHPDNEQSAGLLSLNNGNKWSTDAPLRQAMQNINRAAMDAAEAFHQNTLSNTAAEKLNSYIHEQVEYMVRNCKLEPKADAMLHVIIGELLQAADNMKNQALSMEGLPKIIKALNDYSAYFDHPGWSLGHP